MNKHILAAAISSSSHKLLRQEIHDLIDGIDTWDDIDAFLHIQDLSETEDGWKAFKIPCRKVLIDAGFYVPMTQEEIDSCWVSGGTVWDFKMQHVAYQCVSGLMGWVYED